MPDTTTRRTHSGSIVAVAFLVLLLGAAVGWVMIASQQDSVEAEVLSWEDATGDVMPVTIEVARDPQTALTCELVAVDERYVVVGQLDVNIPAGGDRRQRVEVDVPLRGDALAAELRGCASNE